MHGTYPPQDVTFLLKPIAMASTDVRQKEASIQAGSMHYSEMITHESAPTSAYMSIFHDSLEREREKFSACILALAHQLHTNNNNNDEIVLVSLARAGTPVGVIVTRLLRALWGRSVTHYSVSIIRDKGLDLNALGHITRHHAPEAIVFVDGWTGKGVIGRELQRSVDAFNAAHHTRVSPHLYVVSDISGTAHWSASCEDYLIPSAVLNSTISGLVSRTILNASIGPDDYHGCLVYEHLRSHDISASFADDITRCAITLYATQGIHSMKKMTHQGEINAEGLRAQSKATITQFLATYGLTNPNYIKPGIGESTRVLLRRSARELVVRDAQDANIQHLLHLCKEKAIPVRQQPDLCYHCVAVIETMD